MRIWLRECIVASPSFSLAIYRDTIYAWLRISAPRGKVLLSADKDFILRLRQQASARHYSDFSWVTMGEAHRNSWLSPVLFRNLSGILFSLRAFGSTGVRAGLGGIDSRRRCSSSCNRRSVPKTQRLTALFAFALLHHLCSLTIIFRCVAVVSATGVKVWCLATAAPN